ncbi:hypothetical protein Deba_2287 [Desulfarculus baarsii DSM 2075]|uniref:Uncharacterized protein n=1 Tax=Desulfarculus baarsii (strain ATCC 33931 / DSM 2075 / LMG 7858 / VKM B-1802 / 2st14) TaxID=644282 RepID=E1QJA6_DESB2|nr:hypothetical protein [Desulfarculus baarsii]ADK85649.1 hypothetical protein Deba_2287 [Desulfarculus baarsii DSM 2075]
MARKSKWNEEDRKSLLKMVQDGVAEQEIRETLAYNGKPMTAVEFAQQLKMAMVDSGQIKQAAKTKTAVQAKVYEVTAKGRLSITDFEEVTGFGVGAKFALEKPRGKSKSWRLVPVD